MLKIGLWLSKGPAWLDPRSVVPTSASPSRTRAALAEPDYLLGNFKCLLCSLVDVYYA